MPYNATGGGDGFTLPDVAALDVGNYLSLGCWCRTSTAGGWSKYLARHYDSVGGNYCYMLWWSGGTPLAPYFSCRNSAGSSAGLTGGAGWNDGNWHLIVGVFDGTLPYGNVKLYKDNLAAQTTGLAGYPLLAGDTGLNLNIGLNTFPGDVAELALWNVALTAAQVAAWYNAGPVLGAPLTLHSTPPLVYLPFDGIADNWGSTRNLPAMDVATLTGNATYIAPPGPPPAGPRLWQPETAGLDTGELAARLAGYCYNHNDLAETTAY